MKKEPSIPTNPEETPKVSSKFSPENLRLSQDFSALTSVKKHILTIPVRKPHRQEYVRVHPDSNYRIEAGVLELKDERETYMVAPSLHGELLGEMIPKLIVATINKQGVLFLWPIRLPDPDGKLDAWNQSALEALKIGERAWIRVAANKHMGAYDVSEPVKAFPDPEWPNLTFDQMLETAFKGHFIETPDHQVLKKLRGEI